MWASLLLIVVMAIVVRSQNMKEITIRQGAVRGYRIPGSDVFAFYGIPYATTPTGTNKFMPPLPPPKWSEPLEANNKFIICMQPESAKLPTGSLFREDCLVANVYVPDTDKKNLSVFVMVHGGGFQFEYGASMEPIALVNSKSIIAVSFNYRLGAHGFLCLGTKDIPGNAGMKDQVALFRWVKENISSFGGNPDDVTIEGCSAGGASVDLHTVSPITNGLFKKVMTGSGCNIAAFAVQVDPIENAKYFAGEVLGFEYVNNISALEDFYKSASFEALYSHQNIISSRPDSTVLFAPCVEADLGQERFLDDAPFNILSRKDDRGYPMLYGFTNLEGLLYKHYFNDWKDNMDNNFSNFLPKDIKFNSENEKHEVINNIKSKYFPGNNLVRDNMSGFLHYYSDTFFVYSMLRSLKLFTETRNNRVYLYEYTYVDYEDSFVVPNTKERGADHCDQLIIAFVDKINASDDHLAMRKTITEIYFNFITTGNPVPQNSSLLEWPTANGDGVPYMQLDSELKLWRKSRWNTDLWDDIYEKYYRVPHPPETATKSVLNSRV